MLRKKWNRNEVKKAREKSESRYECPRKSSKGKCLRIYQCAKNILLTNDDHAEPNRTKYKILDTVSKNISTVKLNLTHNILCECDRASPFSMTIHCLCVSISY